MNAWQRALSRAKSLRGIFFYQKDLLFFFFMLPQVYGTFIVNGSFIVLAVGLRGLL